MDPDNRHAAAFEAEDRSSDADAAGNTEVDLAVDLTHERPQHGLRPDRSARWIAGVMAGAALVLIAIVAAVRSDDAQSEAAEPLLRAQLREPLETALIGLENVRMEWMLAEVVRNTDRPLATTARRSSKPTAVPASTVRRSSPPSPALPALPTADVAPVEPARTPDATPPAAPLPNVDEPEPPAIDDVEPDADTPHSPVAS